MVEVLSQSSTSTSAHCGSVPSSSSGPLAGLLPAAFCGRLLTVSCCQVWALVNASPTHPECRIHIDFFS